MTDKVEGYFEIIEPREARNLFSHVSDQIMQDLSSSMEKEYQKQQQLLSTNPKHLESNSGYPIRGKMSSAGRSRDSTNRKYSSQRRNSVVGHSGQPFVSYVNPNDYQTYYKHYVNSRPPMDSEIYEAIAAILQND